MTYKNKKVIAIIPSRYGSKSIKDKHIINFKGKLLVSWSIGQCLNSKKIDKVYFKEKDKL